MPERILAGKYVVQSEIAKGGMGVIYKALDRTLNRVVVGLTRYLMTLESDERV